MIAINTLDVRLYKLLPIEEIPEQYKDGRFLLLYGEPYSVENNCRYAIGSWIIETEEYWERVDDKTQKLLTRDISHWDYEVCFDPTHYCLLPDAPED